MKYQRKVKECREVTTLPPTLEKFIGMVGILFLAVLSQLLFFGCKEFLQRLSCRTLFLSAQ